MQILPGRFAGVSLGDIRRNRHDGPSHLASEAVQFMLGEFGGCAINRFTQVDAVLPNFQLTIAAQTHGCSSGMSLQKPVVLRSISPQSRTPSPEPLPHPATSR